MDDFLDRISKLPPKKLALLVKELQTQLHSRENEQREAIAIVGMGCRFPGADTPEAYWQLLRDGVDAISEVPSERWNLEGVYDPQPGKPGKVCTRYGGFLKSIDRFDPLFFGISPREATSMDPQQLLLLEVVWEALENAGQSAERLSDTKTGVFLGVCGNDHLRKISELGRDQLDMYLATGASPSICSGRISYILGLHGPSVTLDTACSSSLVAVHLACQSLRLRECRAALAGGISLMLSPDSTIMFSRSGLLASDGRCKAFDAAADGFVRSEGCGIVMLKRLSDAIADGDRITAVIQGSAVNQDGRSGGITAPNGVAQQAVIREALAAAQIEPKDVDYVEAHGTGTSLGDPIEVGALTAVYGKSRPKSEPLYIGSVKTNIGHTEGAAGVAGLIKVALSLQSQQMPPHLHFKTPSPHIAWDEASIEIPTQLQAWPSVNTRGIGAVSSFGFSGTNAHIIVAKYKQPIESESKPGRPYFLLPLSGKSAVGLGDQADRYVSHVGSHGEQGIGDVCHTASSGRSHFEHRVAVVGSSREELLSKLKSYREGRDEPGVFAGHADLTRRPEVVFLFTGQGGQYVQMGRQLYETEPVFREVLDRCDALLRPHLAQPLLSVLYPASGESALLDQTDYTHPAMFAVQYGLAQLWRSWGVEPGMVMGHSVGEIVASTVSGMLSMEEGLMLMRERGRLMHSLAQTGMMASVLAGEAQVDAALSRYRDRVSIAALNGPESTVISGERAAVREVLGRLEAEGVKTRVLKVSNSFHSPLVEPVLDEFERIANRVSYRMPEIAQFSSMRLDWVRGSELLDASYWRYNLRNTVRYHQAIRSVYEQGYRVFVEIGPTPILVGMGAQCVPPGEDTFWLPSLRADRSACEQMTETLAGLYVSGVNIDWQKRDHDQQLRKVSIPTYPFQRERFSLEIETRSESGISEQGIRFRADGQQLKTLAQSGGSLRVEPYHTSGAESIEMLRLVDEENNVIAEIPCDFKATDSNGHAPLKQAEDFREWLYRIEWKQATPADENSHPRALPKRWLILADSGGTGASLASLLRSYGHECVLAMAGHPKDEGDSSTFYADLAHPESIEEMYRSIHATGSDWHGIVHLWALDSPDNNSLSAEALEAAQVRNCASLIQLVKSLRNATVSSPPRVWVVGQGLQSVGEKANSVAVAQAPVRGLSRVLAMEHPELQCVTLDLDPAQTEANLEMLGRELFAPGNEDQVAFRAGTRYVARFRHASLKPLAVKPDAICRPDSTYLITGGFGDLGIYVAESLARQGARHLVLMSRRAPSSSVSARIDAIRKSGVEVVPFQGDVSQSSEVAALLEQINATMPPLKGLIHAAGVWEGGVLLQQDWQRFSRVLKPKVQGAWNLHDLTSSLSLDFFVCFSSGASVLGAAGLGDYAAGNAFLDALAALRQSLGLKAASMNWGPWAELGMVRSVTDLDAHRWNEHGMGTIPPELAIETMNEVIARDIVQIAVLPINWQKLRESIPSLGNSAFLEEVVPANKPAKQETSTASKETLSPGLLRAMEPAQRSEVLTRRLQEEAARVLRVSVEQLDISRPLNQFGLDSLMALELKNRIASKYSITVPLVSVLTGPSVADLASRIIDRLIADAENPIQPHSEAAESATRNTMDHQSPEELLENLPNLSDSEVDALLKQIAESD